MLFVWVVFKYKSTKHFDHCVSKFTVCKCPFKFLLENKNDLELCIFYCGGDLRNIMSLFHRL